MAKLQIDTSEFFKVTALTHCATNNTVELSGDCKQDEY